MHFEIETNFINEKQFFAFENYSAKEKKIYLDDWIEM
jgi:hypothetical protein